MISRSVNSGSSNLYIESISILYTRLETGRIIMVWYGDVRLSVRPSVSSYYGVGLHPSVFCTFLLHALIYLVESLHITFS